MPVVPRRSRNPKLTNSIITSQMRVELFNLLTIAACREKPSSVPRACDACCANDPWACGQCAMCTATHHQTISRMVACYAGIAQLLLTAASRKVLARRLRDPAKCYVGAFHPIAAEKHWAHGVVVSHPLSMREALGSIPSVSTLCCPLVSLAQIQPDPARCSGLQACPTMSEPKCLYGATSTTPTAAAESCTHWN